MTKKFRSWFFAQPLGERRALVVWIGSIAGLLGVGSFAYLQLPEAMDVFYYLSALFILNSALFFALYRQIPTMRITMLTLIFALELTTLGYYILSGVALNY